MAHIRKKNLYIHKNNRNGSLLAKNGFVEDCFSETECGVFPQHGTLPWFSENAVLHT